MGSDAVSHGLASIRSGPVRKYCRGQVQDRDGDPLTYTVVGRPSNGGVVVIDQNTGNFAYRPMNAMAATGGTDTFTVVVSDGNGGTATAFVTGIGTVNAVP